MSVVKGSLLDKGVGEKTIYASTSSLPTSSDAGALHSSQLNPSYPQFAQQQSSQRIQAYVPLARSSSQPMGNIPPMKRNRPKALSLDVGQGQLGLLAEAALNSPSEIVDTSRVTIQNGRQCRVPRITHQSAHIRAALFIALSQQQSQRDENTEPSNQKPAPPIKPDVQRLESPFKAPKGGTQLRTNVSDRSAFRVNSKFVNKTLSSHLRSFASQLGTPVGTPLNRGMSLPIPSSPLSFLYVPSVPISSLYPSNPPDGNTGNTNPQPSVLPSTISASDTSAEKTIAEQPSSDSTSKSNAALLTAAAASSNSLSRLPSFPSGSLFAPFSPTFTQSPSGMFPAESFFFPSNIVSSFPPSTSAPVSSGVQRLSSGEYGYPLGRSFSSQTPNESGIVENDDLDAGSEASGKLGYRRRNQIDSYWPENWLTMPCVQFNKLMKTHSLTVEQMIELKRARRRRKNRTYAKRSRDKKNAKIEETMAKFQALENTLKLHKSDENDESEENSQMMGVEYDIKMTSAISEHLDSEQDYDSDNAVE